MIHLRKDIKIKVKKTRRGKRKSSKNICKSLRFLGVNAAGLRPKLLTFKKVLSELKPSVFFCQETKFKETGKLKINDYVIFEKVRNNKDGGGLAIGCLPELYPVWVREGEDSVEALSVNIFVKKLKIRCCVAYGCQENDVNDKKEAFWKYMEEEVNEATNSESGLILQFDGNLWAGEEIIPNDPRPQNRNGKLFQHFLERNPHLTVVNSLSLCEGLITRSRFREGNLEESVLDFFVVCQLVLPHVTKMVVDEERKYILTNYQNAKKGRKTCDTDHATEYMDVDLKIITEKPKRVEIWNFKNIEAQNKFKIQTSETNEFSSCFENNLPILDQIENWRNVFKSHCSKSFKKVRINKKKKIKHFPSQVSKLIDKRNQLMKIETEENKIEAKQIDEEVSSFEAETNRNKIMQHFKSFSGDPENINVGQVWKTLNKISPKHGISVPRAKKDHMGKIVSAPSELTKLLAKEYKERLRTRPIRPDLGYLGQRKQRILQMKLKLASNRTSSPWTMSDLEAALKDLKNNKSRDPEGLVNELFKLNVIGDDLKKSLLNMFNGLKSEQKIAPFMNFVNVTTVPKKGSPLLLESERGIFRVHVLRYILMRMIYNDKYPVIDKNMSDCQMGGRKRKGCRNNIFIVNGIIHDVMSSKKKEAVTLQIYDYKQMFDAINLEQAASDIFDVGVSDDNLTMIYNANKDVKMAVNTPNGLSERQTLKNVVLQGDTFGSILASVQVDSIGKELEETNYGYMYKDELPVGMMALVDDLIGVTKAGYKAQQMNTALNVKTAEKRLQFGVKKCKSMLISKDIVAIPNNGLKVDNWKVNHVENTSTGGSDLVETYEGERLIEKTEKQKYLGFFLSSRGDNMVNIKEMKCKSIWLIRKIFTKLNDLNLKKYYFECGMVFLNVMLRPSILYACETYYNLKEYEIRQLERIEENYLRKMFKTTKGSPIVQLYLESGHTPARFEVKKIRLLFLQYILKESPDSRIYKFLQLQMKEPTRGDWATNCKQDLRDFQIEMTFEEIQSLSNIQFNRILKEAIKVKAFEYLMKKRGSKGLEIEYFGLQMAEYLMPNFENHSIDNKRKIFEIRNRMLPISANFPSSKEDKICWCGQNENTKHIYICKYWCNESETTKFEMIYTDDMPQLSKVFKQYEIKLKLREDFKIEYEKNTEERNLHVIDKSDPLFSNVESSNGNKL